MRGVVTGFKINAVLAAMILLLALMAVSFNIGRAEIETDKPGSAPVPIENDKVNPVMPEDEVPLFNFPTSVKQGEVLRVSVKLPKSFEKGTVSLADRTARLFRQPSGQYLGLLPVSVFQKPGGYTLKIMDDSGVVRHTLPITILNAKYPVQNIAVSKSTQGLQPLPGEMETIEALKNLITDVRFWDEPFLTPTTDCQNSPFGVKRAYNGKLSDNYHRGVDLRSPSGRPIRATNSGMVKIAKMYRLHGGTVGIDHGQGVSSIYIHMSKIAAKEGQKVNKGDVIGYVGSTGFATGPHLHWGLYVSGMPVNPNQFVKNVPRCG